MQFEEINLIDGTKVVIDHAKRWVKCKKCCKQIRFAVTKNNQYMPIEKFGDQWRSHFPSCTSGEKKEKFEIEEDRNQEFLNNL